MVIHVDLSHFGDVSITIGKIAREFDMLQGLQLWAKQSDISHHLDVIDWYIQGFNSRKDTCMK